MIKKSLIFDFPACSEQVKELIAKNALRQVYKKGDVITSPGDNLKSIKFIYSGKVRVLMIDSAGYERILYILYAGWFLRESLFLDQINSGTARHYSIAEDDVVIYLINKNTYSKLAGNKMFMESLLNSSAKKRSILVNELYSVTFNSSEKRVIDLLLASIKSEKMIVDKFWLPLKYQYTHLDMGRILGINRVTVSKIINNLSKEGLIRVVNKKIQVNINCINIKEATE